MRSLLPLIALIAACSTEPAPTFEPLADPPEIESPDVLTYTAPAEAPVGMSAPAEIDPVAPVAEEAEVAESGLPDALFSTGPDDPVGTITLADGESLALLASWTNVTAEEIASLNDIDVSDALYPGQELILPEHAVVAVGSARAEFTEIRLGRYLDRRGGLAGLRTYRVKTGDTAWSIAREEVGVPTWILAHYNSETALDRLIIGQELLVPVLGDEAAAALDEPEVE